MFVTFVVNFRKRKFGQGCFGKGLLKSTIDYKY